MGTLYRNGVPYIGGGSGSEEASQIHYDNTKSGIPSTSVQGAIDELASLDSTTIETFDGATAVNAARGNPATISNEASGNALEVTATLNPIQDLNGYDHPWAGGAGKNKLVFPYESAAGTYHGVDVTVNSDGTIILNGETTERGDITLYFSSSANTGLTGSYILTSGFANNDVTINARIRNISSATNRYAYSSNGIVEITTKENEVLNRVYLNFSGAGIAFSNVKIYPMLRLASETDATYEPYSNICPITGRTSVDVTRTGENLCPTVIMHRDYNNNTGEDLTSSSQAASVKFPFNKDKTYVFTKNCNVNAMFFGWDAQGNFVGRVSGDNTSPRVFNKSRFTNGNGTKDYNSITQIAVKFYQASGQDINDVVGAEYRLYEQDSETSVTVDLGQTVYGGTLNVTTGVLTVNRVMVTYDGSENWATNGTNGVALTFGTLYERALISNRYVCLENGGSARMGNGYCRINAIGTTILVHDENAMTGDSYKVYLASNPLQIVYKLATPQTIQLTPTQIQLLAGTNIISASADDLLVRCYASGKSNVEGSLKYLSDKIAALDADKTDYFTIENDTDLNTLLNSGVYRSPNTTAGVGTLANCPVGAPFTMLVTGSGKTTLGCVQTIFTDNYIYVRRGNNGGFLRWVLFVSDAGLTVQFPSTGWTTTETVNGTTYYTQTVSVTMVGGKPIIGITPISGTLPTSAEQKAFDSVSYFTANDTTNTIKAYATSAPSDTFAVVVKGAR